MILLHWRLSCLKSLMLVMLKKLIRFKPSKQSSLLLNLRKSWIGSKQLILILWKLSSLTQLLWQILQKLLLKKELLRIRDLVLTLYENTSEFVNEKHRAIITKGYNYLVVSSLTKNKSYWLFLCNINNQDKYKFFTILIFSV